MLVTVPGTTMSVGDEQGTAQGRVSRVPPGHAKQGSVDKRGMGVYISWSAKNVRERARHREQKGRLQREATAGEVPVPIPPL